MFNCFCKQIYNLLPGFHGPGCARFRSVHKPRVYASNNTSSTNVSYGPKRKSIKQKLKEIMEL